MRGVISRQVKCRNEFCVKKMSIVTYIKQAGLATIICAIGKAFEFISFTKSIYVFSTKIVASIIEHQMVNASLWAVFAIAPKRAFKSAVLPSYNKSSQRIAKATAA